MGATMDGDILPADRVVVAGHGAATLLAAWETGRGSLGSPPPVRPAATAPIGQAQSYRISFTRKTPLMQSGSHTAI
jgi:hypothetical protein